MGYQRLNMPLLLHTLVCCPCDLVHHLSSQGLSVIETMPALNLRTFYPFDKP